MDEKHDFDVVIVGGGPGGLSALHWCADLGMTAILIEKEAQFGGQLLYTYNPITNYLGSGASNGGELRDIFLGQLSDHGGTRITEAEVLAADLERKVLTLADGAAYSGRSIIIATGVRRRELGIPGERDFRGRGLLESGAKEKDAIGGKHVVIIGGGDAALENALIVAEKAGKVTLIHRREVFSARQDFLERARRNDRIQFRTNCTVAAITGSEKLEAVELGNGETFEADAVLIRIGVEPNSEAFRGQIDLDSDGYVVIDRDCATSLPRVFAIGDVANANAPTIAAAVGQGSIAAKTIAGQLNGPSRRQ